MSRHWWIPWQLRSAASRCSPQLFCQIVPVSGRNFSVTVPSHEVLLTQLYLACLSKEEKEYGQKRGLRERKWRNKSKSNWTGSSLSQRMPTNCKAALKKWEETTGRKCSEATEVQGDLFNWSSLLEFSTKMIKVANNEYFSMKLLGILSFCYWKGGGVGHRRFSQNFTKVNLLLPKLPKPRSAHVHRGREKGGALSWFQLSQFSTAGEADRGVPTNREDGRQCWSSRLLCQTVSLHKHDHKVGALSFGFFFVTRSSKSDWSNNTPENITRNS